MSSLELAEWAVYYQMVDKEEAAAQDTRTSGGRKINTRGL